MPESELLALLSGMRQGRLRSRTALILLPGSAMGHEPELAARCNIEAVDYAELVCRTQLENSQLLGIDAVSEEERLDKLVSAEGELDCVLLYNTDLILARLGSSDRAQLWAGLRERFPYRPRILFIVLPEESRLLMPQGEERSAWEQSGRIIRWATPDPSASS